MIFYFSHCKKSQKNIKVRIKITRNSQTLSRAFDLRQRLRSNYEVTLRVRHSAETITDDVEQHWSWDEYGNY